MVKIFSIEGNIGSGKSTLVKLLREKYINVIFLDEPVERWNCVTDSSGITILEKYYSDQQNVWKQLVKAFEGSRLSQFEKLVSISTI